MLRSIPKLHPKVALDKLLGRNQPHPNWLSEQYTQNKKKIVVLGTGWGSFSFTLRLNKQLYDLHVVSPRNHFLFTPLLTSTTVGTLEFRAITEPIRAVSNLKAYHHGRCIGVDTDTQQVQIRDSFDEDNVYNIPYDVLIYGVGAQVNDFGIPGVVENAHFCKQIRHAIQIRNSIVEKFERASKPNTSREERERLLSFCIVGGGPTSIELAGELWDWLTIDGMRMFPDLVDCVSVTLIEATSTVLAAFSQDLRDYTLATLRKRRVRVLLNSQVVKVDESHVYLKDGYKTQYGLLVWATGVAPVPLTQTLDWCKSRSGRILVDGHQRVLVPAKQVTAETEGEQTTEESGMDGMHVLTNVFAIGDACESIIRPLAPTAQPAKQQGYYCADLLNELTMKDCVDKELFQSELQNLQKKPFKNSHRGLMAALGGYKAAVFLGEEDKSGGSGSIIANVPREINKRLRTVTGLFAWLAWRSAYFTMTVSTPNKLLIPTYWFGTFLFGRSFTRFTKSNQRTID